MANTSTVNHLIGKLTMLLVEEVKLLTGVKDNVTLLRKELSFMNVFMKNIEQGRQKEHDIVAEVVSQIRDVAHEAEDLIDTYIANIIKQERRNLVVRGVTSATFLHSVADKISKIKNDINDVLDNKNRYGIEAIGGRGDNQIEEAERIRKQRREVEEEKDVVGFVRNSKVVINQLMENDSRLKVVSIVGMGGLGKTTLGRKIFNSDKVQDTFPCRAWGYVSNDYRPREFFLSLLKWLLLPSQYEDLVNKSYAQAGLETSISEEELKMKVRECLNKSNNKYLVVVDDVWEEQVWNEVKGAFPDNNSGSRILITSRLAKVAASGTCPTHPYKLPLLNKQQSWELLSKNLFWGEKCPSYLEPMGKLIAESCGGLPLAVIVMARILANKKLQSEYWCSIKEHMNWHLGRDNMLNDILKLSYDNLPPRLKPCFLYLGMFPEDYEIPVKQLIRLWISEGFLIQETCKTSDMPEPEYIAREYLDELVERSLVQVVSRSSDGSVKTCQLHNIVRNLCITESKDDKFFDVCKGIDFQTLITCPRRLSLHEALFPFTSSALSQSCISTTRSLLCFDQEALGKPIPPVMKSKHWKWLLKNFKMGRVLDLGRIKIKSLSNDLDELIHLRYLKIHSHNLETIPTSICRLWCLETLDLRGCLHLKSFSSELWQLKQLRHLLMTGPVALPNTTSETKTMPNLQTLSTVALDPRTTSLLDNRRFPRLTKLGLHYKKSNPTGIELQRLHCLSHLQKLKVIGTTELPHNALKVFPSSITKITLTKFGFFNSSAMNTLGNLPNLHILKLSLQTNNASLDLHCAEGGFPQLQVFVMVGIKVKSWTVDKGSMPHLQRLVLRNNEFLAELPQELCSLTNLRIEQAWCHHHYA